MQNLYSRLLTAAKADPARLSTLCAAAIGSAQQSTQESLVSLAQELEVSVARAVYSAKPVTRCPCRGASSF